MENDQTPRFSVGDFIAVANQTLEIAFGSVEIVGEVSSFKVNQNKYVFFDLKDSEGSIGCFMMVYALRTPLEDGMKVIIRAVPKITKWGKFSLTVQAIRPVGEGSIKKSFEILKKKLEAEGLFSEDRKRALPPMPKRIGVISSVQAAGYADFMKIVDERWGGLKIEVAHVAVQGEGAADQMIRAIRYFNTLPELPEVLVIIRGGGSADDLAAFNDELLVREIAASRIPTLVGVGHEVDVSLADMVADVRAATPSNAAQIVVPDKRQIESLVNQKIHDLGVRTVRIVDQIEEDVENSLRQMLGITERKIDSVHDELLTLERVLRSVDPMTVLERGYAIVRGEMNVGGTIELEMKDVKLKAKVEERYEK